MSGIGNAVKNVKYGQTRTEGCLYFMMTALLIGVIAVVLEMVLPGQEFTLGEYTFFISHDFYLRNMMWFITFSSMLGMGISFIVIHWHRRSVNKRLSTAHKIGRGK